jgi:Glycosyltransferase like family
MLRDSNLARQLHNDAVGLARNGRHREACAKLRDAVRAAGVAEVDPRTLKALWQVARMEEDWPTALAAGLRGAIRDPLDFPFIDKVVRSLHECPLSALVPDSCYPMRKLPADLPTLSVIIVSRDDERYAGVDAQFGATFSRWPHERIRIADATSMYDGYARGYAQAHGELVVFSHDDIRFAVPDFAARLAETMADTDFAGVAGTTRVSGPALLWAGHPHLHGSVTHKAPADTSHELALTSMRGPKIGQAQGLDGVFIAARREWVERVGFDTGRIPGFHLYDLDFSYRAYLAGARLTIACDLALIHQSRGNFDSGWNAAQAAFAAKFPELNSAPGKYRHWYHVSLPDEAAVTSHYAKLFAAWALDLDERAA